MRSVDSTLFECFRIAVRIALIRYFHKRFEVATALPMSNRYSQISRVAHVLFLFWNAGGLWSNRYFSGQYVFPTSTTQSACTMSFSGTFRLTNKTSDACSWKRKSWASHALTIASRSGFACVIICFKVLFLLIYYTEFMECLSRHR